MTYDATSVKTYQPIIPAGVGPLFESAEDALTEIFADINENAPQHADDIDGIVKMFVSIVSDWIDGTYTVFEDYQLVIKHYQRGQLDNMREFDGY